MQLVVVYLAFPILNHPYVVFSLLVIHDWRIRRSMDSAALEDRINLLKCEILCFNVLQAIRQLSVQKRHDVCSLRISLR